MVRVRILSFLFAFIIVFGITNASAQLTVEEVNLGDGALARYRAPAVGAVSHIAFLAIHRTADFRNHQSTTELANRGFGTLGIRTRFGNSEAAVNWELIALDIRNGMRFLKDVKGHTHVILIGHSGGGPSTSYFQAVAENGPSYCKGRDKLTECPFTGAEFTPADRANGIVFTDAHPGNTINRLRSLNGSVVNEDQPFGPVNEKLDPFSEANGFNPDGDSVFSDHFVDRYSKAQSRRLNRLIREALKIKREIERGKRNPADDAFVIFRTSARLSDFSTGVHRGTLEPRKLLKNDGSIDGTQIVNTVRVPDPGNKQDDEGNAGIQNLTITSFLSASAIRSKHSLDDIDWCSSNNSTVCAVREISVPTLVMTMQGHYFIRDGEQIYEESASADKDFVVVEGAIHNLDNCPACAAFHGTGPYTNVPLNLWNYVAGWANARF
jgi:hypothetical protein